MGGRNPPDSFRSGHDDGGRPWRLEGRAFPPRLWLGLACTPMNLGMFYWPCGHHMAAWRHPGAVADSGANIGHIVELAKLAERGLFDLFFMADSVSFWRGDLESMTRDSFGAWIEPFTVMCSLAQHTSRIGLVCTSTTTYDQPYSLARRFASLDVASGGRAGWNLITSANKLEAASFGLDRHLEKTERYRRAREFAHVVRGLWSSWGEGVFVRDKDSGLYFDADQAERAGARGRAFPGARADQRAALAAGRAGDGAGRRLRRRAPARRRDRGGDLRRAADHRGGASVLCRREGPHGRLRPRSRIRSRSCPGSRSAWRRRGTRPRTSTRRCRRSSTRWPGCSSCRGASISTSPATTSTARCPSSRPTRRCRQGRTSSPEIGRRENLTIRDLYRRIAGARGHYEIVGTPAARRRHDGGVGARARLRRLQHHAAGVPLRAWRTSSIW